MIQVNSLHDTGENLYRKLQKTLMNNKHDILKYKATHKQDLSPYFLT